MGAIDAAEHSESITAHLPEFRCTYEPDARQVIADSWPRSLDDSAAREDWGWQPKYDLPRMTAAMLAELRRRGVSGQTAGNPT